MDSVMLAVHMVGAVAWVGGLSAMAWVVLPAARQHGQHEVVVDVLNRFQFVSRACSVLMLLSGGFLIGTRYPASTWFSTRGGAAAFGMMVLWLALTGVVEMASPLRRSLLQAGASSAPKLVLYYNVATVLGWLLILDGVWGLG